MQPILRTKTWKAELDGMIGLFEIGSSLKVEYIQTSLDNISLGKVEPVRRLFKKNELDFELLLQRDLEDDRIANDLIPYLAEINRLRFFPAITIVLIAKENNQLINRYPAMSTILGDDEGGYKKWTRKFGELFEIEAYVSSDTEANSDISPKDIISPYVKLRVGHDANLLVIDGQHRLVALQAVLDQIPDSAEKDLYLSALKGINVADYKNMHQPATILYIPQLNHEEPAGSSDIRLVEAFRQVFVDINRNARTVSEFRNILLDEHDLNSIFTREICSSVKKNEITKPDSITIDCIEWDKLNKENQLTKKTSITNVVFIKQSFEAWLGKGDRSDDGSRLFTNLKLNQIRDSIDEEDIGIDAIRINYFSYSQKKCIVKYFQENYLHGIIRLINSIPYVVERSSIVTTLKDNLKNHETEDTEESKYVSRVYKYLFEGSEYIAALRDNATKRLYREKIKDLEDFDEDHGYCFAKGQDYVRTNMFYTAFFNLVYYLHSADFITFADFSIFSEKLSNHLREHGKGRWKKYNDIGRLLLNRILEKPGMAGWKLAFVEKLLFILLIGGTFSLGTAEGIKAKKDEYKEALIEETKKRLEEQVNKGDIDESERESFMTAIEAELKQIIEE